uniref:Uncharacterized protein n=1 Tax=Tetranychus urticae TaxID=32264 RepID=T1KP47_TETUR
MTEIVPSPSESDYTILIEDASVIVKDCDGADKGFRIIPAIYFTKDRTEIGKAIKDSKEWPDPTGICASVIIVYYDNESKCTSKLRLITAGPLIMSTSKKKASSDHGHVEKRVTRRVQNSMDNYPLDNCEITSGFNSMKRYLESLSSKFETMNKNFSERLSRIEDKLEENPTRQYRDQSLNITDQALSIMAECRADSKWRKRIKTMTWDSLNEEKTEEIRKLLLKSNKSASKTAISIAQVVFGEKLKTHILGDNGKLVRAPREGERQEVIPKVEEDILKAILFSFGHEFFSDPTNWEVLVRGPVNQSGRERKRKRYSPSEVCSKVNLPPDGTETSTQIPEDLVSSRKRQRLGPDELLLLKMEDYLNDFEQNFPSALKAILEDLNNRLVNLEVKLAQLPTNISPCHGNTMFNMNPEYPIEWKFKCPKDFTDYIETRLNQIKHDPEWRKNFQCIEFSGFSAESKERVIAILTKEKANASRLVNAIAKEIIGKEKLTMFTLGSHGMPVVVGASKLLARPPLGEDDENKLRQVLGFIDKLFVSREGWEILVRKPVNQMGREFKRNRRSDPINVGSLECEPDITTLPSSTHVMAISHGSDSSNLPVSTLDTRKSSSVQKEGDGSKSLTNPNHSPVPQTYSSSSYFSRNYDFLKDFDTRSPSTGSRNEFLSKERNEIGKNNLQSKDSSPISSHGHNDTSSASRFTKKWC